MQSVNNAVAKWITDNNNTNPSIDIFINGSQLDNIYRKLYNRATIQEARISWRLQDPDNDQKDIIDMLASLFAGDADIADGAPIRLWRQLLNDYLSVRIAGRISEVEQNTKKRIATLIERGIAEGLGAGPLARSIRDDKDFNRNRSLAVARTETVTALNQGKYLAAQSSPYVMEKKWSPTIDARTRLSHADMIDRPFIALDQPFYLANAKGALEEAQYPGAPTLSASNVVNCRCSLITKAKVGSNGRPIRKSMAVKSVNKLFTTELKAIDPMDGKLKTWVGPRIPAKSWEEAEMFVKDNGMGYLNVDGEFVDEKE